MNSSIMLDQFHLTLFIPEGTSEDERVPMRDIIDSATFQAQLRLACQNFIRKFPDLEKVQLKVSR